MHVLSIIPARIGSARLPEKPLCTIAGEPLIRLVARRVLEFNLETQVVVATDDERVVEAVAPLGLQGLITRSSHQSGTERVAEVLEMPEFSWARCVLNVQGDELFLPREAAVGALDQLDRSCEIGTAAALLVAADRADPNRVKVTVDGAGRGRHFSRSPVAPVSTAQVMGVHLHLGVYAYSRETVFRWVELPRTRGEQTERLEQLRPLEHGLQIGVATIEERVVPGIDTPADLRTARALFSETRIYA